MSSPGGWSTGGLSLLELVDGLEHGLLERALTHSSWVSDRVRSYERLEFLGDSVLGLSIAGHLYERFDGAREGELARWKAFVVSRRSCHAVACRLGLDRLVRNSAPGDEGQREDLAGNPTALGNILEALIGACYLAYGHDVVGEAVVRAFSEQVDYAVREYVDYKSTLQETLATEGRAAEYELTAEDGPPHDRVFHSRVSSDGVILGHGSGRSIKQSEQRAAREALGRLGVLSLDEGRGPESGSPADGRACAPGDEG